MSGLALHSSGYAAKHGIVLPELMDRIDSMKIATDILSNPSDIDLHNFEDKLKLLLFFIYTMHFYTS
ncbi:MAG TPA: hypothetical protein C5S50_06520 [Methanosarcinaceae archaeon]|nr:hypothetical protein [Methanosarcinaceae archaeon]